MVRVLGMVLLGACVENPEARVESLDNGPDGAALMETSCNLMDGYGLRLWFGLEEAVCGGIPSAEGWVRLDIWSTNLSDLTLGTYSFAWDNGIEDGGASYSTNGVDYVTGGGWIEITTIQEAGVSGYYEIVTEQGDVIGAEFTDVASCDEVPMCG
jgi:hypothetical protein